ncbi:MAG: PTS sugar transporter subunit IIA [Proteobacteria bacterium]|nr:PTS sugar transporter subunit IIA [Pseudomonadota bacterium]
MREDVLKISDFIETENIYLDVELTDKEAVLKFIAQTAGQNSLVTNDEMLFKGLALREESMSTGVGQGIAFPHTTTPERDQAAVMIIRLSTPVPFDAIDDQDVDIVFAIIIPESNQTQHLQILARVSRLCRKTEFTGVVRRAKDPQRLKDAIKGLEDEITGFFYQS